MQIRGSETTKIHTRIPSNCCAKIELDNTLYFGGCLIHYTEVYFGSQYEFRASPDSAFGLALVQKTVKEDIQCTILYRKTIFFHAIFGDIEKAW